MDWGIFIYYAGFLTAIILCWNLGRLFAIPMVLDLIFDICVMTIDFPGWMVRWMMLGYGLAIFLWVLALSGIFTRSMFVLLTCLEIAIVASRLWAPVQATGVGFDFWNTVCSSIYDIWLISIFVAVAAVVIKSGIIARLQGHRVDLLTNPKKRFVLPIGAWAGIMVLPTYLEPFLPVAFVENRYKIAAQVLVWGWVALELPFYWLHKRLMRGMQ